MTDIIDAVTARLIGHDPRGWEVKHASQVIDGHGAVEGWFALHVEHEGLWFETDREALHFCRTGVRS